MSGGVFSLLSVDKFIGGSDEVDHNVTYTSADEVVPGLWIGNQASAADINFLKKHDIKTIINCSTHIPFVEHHKHKRVAVRIPVLDPGPFKSLGQKDIDKMYTALPKAISIIKKSIEKGGVLVHCHAGMQRSAAVIVAYLAQFHFNNCKPDEAYERAVSFLQEKRPRVFYHGWHVNFQSAIKKYLKYYIKCR